MNTITKIILSAVMVFTMTIVNAQSKKEQIENLTFSLDSLNQLVAGERQKFKTTLDSLNQLLSKNQQYFEIEIASYSIEINNLNTQIDSLISINDSINLQLKIKNQNIDSLILQKLELLADLDSLSLSKIDKGEEFVNHDNSEYYIIEDPDGYSNLREVPSGNVIRKVYVGEKFEILGEENNYKKVKFPDSSTGYIHNSRVVNFNDKVCECLHSADEMIKKDLDKDFSTGSETGFSDNWNPSYTERLVEIFRYNQCPKGCDFLGDHDVIDFQNELQRCSE